MPSWRRRRGRGDEPYEEEIWIDPRGPADPAAGDDHPDEDPVDEAAAEAEHFDVVEADLADGEPDGEVTEEKPETADVVVEAADAEEPEDAEAEEPEAGNAAQPEAALPDEDEEEPTGPAPAPLRDVIRPGRDSERLGPRRAALQEKRRRTRRRVVTGLSVMLATLAVIAAVVVLDFGGDDDPRRGTGTTAAGVTEDNSTTMLLFGTKEASSRPNAIWMNLLYLDRDEKRGAIVYIPAHSAVEVPGRGLQAVGDSLSSGGVPLLLLSTETLLGIPIDNYVELSNTDARLLFNATGPLSIDVPDQVRVEAGPNTAKLIFDEGLQRLPSSYLVQLLYTVGLDADDVDLGARHAAFWGALFDQFQDEPEVLGDAIDVAGGALGESDTTPEEVAALLEEMAALDQPDRTLTSLPVTPVSVGGSELFESDTEEIATFMRDTLGVEPASVQEARVQILNGNGEPGIGKVAAEKLVGEGFRVVLTGNAPRLDYRNTLIVSYDPGPEGTALAERARDLLGVGKLQVSAQGQGIVDLTIVVGKDFLRTR